MTTLTEFLLARIAERVAAITYAYEQGLPFPVLSPAEMLADCESKRRIVEALSPLVDYDRGTHIVMRGTENVATTTLHLLALPYAAQPDYREEWKP